VTGGWWAVIAASTTLLVGLYLSGLAGRLHRLHLRVEAAAASLDAQLARRAVAALETATSGLLDVASSVLIAQAAHAAQSAGPADREGAESELSQSLRATLDGGALAAGSAPGEGELGALVATSQRVVLARRFYNDAVAATIRLRRQRLVRYLRLAGSAPMPRTFEMDDEPLTGAVTGPS